MEMLNQNSQPTQFTAEKIRESDSLERFAPLQANSTADLSAQLPLSLREQHRRRQASVARGGALISGNETLGRAAKMMLLDRNRVHNRTLVDRSGSLGRNAAAAYGISGEEAQDTYLEDVLARAFVNNERRMPIRRERPADWETQLPSDRKHYETSPVARHSQRNGSLSPDRYATRTFNRKMKMKDTFTRILPSYNHEPRSCYSKAASHILHEKYEKDLEDRPMFQIDRSYTHKYDPVKIYSEEMYKLGVFAPQPRKKA